MIEQHTDPQVVDMRQATRAILLPSVAAVAEELTKTEAALELFLADPENATFVECIKIDAAFQRDNERRMSPKIRAAQLILSCCDLIARRDVLRKRLGQLRSMLDQNPPLELFVATVPAPASASVLVSKEPTFTPEEQAVRLSETREKRYAAMTPQERAAALAKEQEAFAAAVERNRNMRAGSW